MTSKQLYKVIFVLCLLMVLPCQTDAQFWKKRNKGTSKREIRKRQEEANKKSNYNRFNELQPMGKKASLVRIDYIWSYETANTVPEKGGDINLIMPSRFSTKSGIEFGTSIASLPFIPTVYLKKRWTKGVLYVATRHQVYSYSPLLYFAQKNEYCGIFPGNAEVPNSYGIKNELIISKPFLKDLKCGSVKQPYIIITAALAIDYGFATKSTEQELMERKFFKQRSGVVLGKGGFLTARLQGDLFLLKDLYLTIAVRGLFAGSPYGNSIEQNTMIKYKVSPKFSMSLGYWASFGKGEGAPVVPLFDLSYHFGYKEGREKGLFGSLK
ncbi:hypothetical protein E9993_18695 [Labilibacter sediminis]|nr:hypothetical protein E9993_18695 [Labilibacter sediminis]